MNEKFEVRTPAEASRNCWSKLFHAFEIDRRSRMGKDAKMDHILLMEKGELLETLSRLP